MQYKPCFSRRIFLQRMALLGAGSGVAVLGLAGCQRPPVSTPESYYTDRRDDYIKENRAMFNAVRPLLAAKWDDPTADAVVEAALRRFEVLLPGLPYIGGTDNDLTANLVSAALGLALYFEMKDRGAAVEDTGRVLFQAAATMFGSDPMSGVMGQLSNSALAQDKIKKEAEASQKKTYPEDWVFSFVEGGADFDFGIDYTECGICKYFKAQGAQELTPYMCLLDVPISRAMNTGLVRTKTLARGDNCCDFRYRGGRDVQAEWDPGYVQGGK